MRHRIGMRLLGPVVTERAIAALFGRYEATGERSHEEVVQRLITRALSIWPRGEGPALAAERSGHYRVTFGGWAGDVTKQRRVERIVIRTADGREHVGRIGERRRDVVQHFGAGHLLNSGYSMDLAIDSERPLEGLQALARWSDGTETALAFTHNVVDALQGIGLEATAPLSSPNGYLDNLTLRPDLTLGLWKQLTEPHRCFVLSAVRSSDWMTFDAAQRMGELQLAKDIAAASSAYPHLSSVDLARAHMVLGDYDSADAVIHRWARSSRSQSVGSVASIRPAAEVSETTWLVDPVTVHVSLPEIWSEREAGAGPRDLETPALGVYHVRDATILRGSTVLTHQGELLLYEPAADPSLGFVAGNWDHITGAGWKSSWALIHANHNREERLDEGILLSGRCDFNHYHFLIEYLPRLLLAERIRELDGVPIIVTTDLNPSGFEALDLLSPDRPVVEIDRDSKVSVAKLHIPSFHTDLPDSTDLPWIDGSRHSPDLLLQMRQRLWGAVPAAADLPNRIYLRRTQGARTLENIEDIDEVAADHSFTTVDPAALSFSEQLDLFRGAKVLLGVGGAAWANLIFCREGTTIISMVARQLHDFAMHSTVAEVAGSRMVCVLGESSRRAESFRHRRDYLHSSFSIEPATLSAALTSLAGS
jgi:hypothetical protein